MTPYSLADCMTTHQPLKFHVKAEYLPKFSIYSVYFCRGFVFERERAERRRTWRISTQCGTQGSRWVEKNTRLALLRHSIFYLLNIYRLPEGHCIHYCLLLHRASCRFTNHHTTNKCTNCMSFILNHFLKHFSLLLHVSITYRLSSSGSTYSS